MDQATFKALCEKTVRDTSAILVSKGEEYAGSQDRLANFKRGAQLTGATPLQVAFVYASKHYDSIATFIKKDAQGFEQRLSEPIEGRFDDLINYCILMKAIVQEEQELLAARKAGKTNNSVGLTSAPKESPTIGEMPNEEIAHKTIQKTLTVNRTLVIETNSFFLKLEIS